MSKGSRPRPYSVSQETFANNYDAIFGKKDKNDSRVEEMKKVHAVAAVVLQATVLVGTDLLKKHFNNV